MKLVGFFCFVWINLANIEAGDISKCEISGVREFDWYCESYDLPNAIYDIHEGVIATLETTNILEISNHTSEYLKAELLNGTLIISTNEKFKDYERNIVDYYSESVSIWLDFKCIENGTESLTFVQSIVDTNNNKPEFDRDVYEYYFGMNIPENYNLASFLPIKIKDIDFSNLWVYSTMDVNENFKINYYIDRNNDETEYFASLQALKEIKAPFKQEYTVLAMDSDTTRNTTARLMISVRNGNSKTDVNDTEISHPPVFGKHLYFASYSQGSLEIDEKIVLKYGAKDDTDITQSDFEEYFKITLDAKIDGSLTVALLGPLPKTLLDSSLLVIEIEAVNKGLSHMPGRTALIIRLIPDKNENSQNDCNLNISGTSADKSISLLLFISALAMVILMNVLVFVWSFQKPKTIQAVNPSYFNNTLFKQEKMYKI